MFRVNGSCPSASYNRTVTRVATPPTRSTRPEIVFGWEARSGESYMSLFNRVRVARGLSAQNLSFAEFQGVEVTPQDVGLRPADDRYI